MAKKDDTVNEKVWLEVLEEGRKLMGKEKVNWYDWRNMHWGTKWELNPNSIEMIDEGCYIEYSFDTAWSPPLGILRALDRKFHFKKDQDLHIQWHYREDGMGFTGYLEHELED